MNGLRWAALCVVVAAVLLLAVGSIGYGAADSDREADVAVVQDERAYAALTLDPVHTEGGETSVLTLRNKFAGPIDDLSVEVVDDGGLGVSESDLSVPDGPIAPGEDVEIAADVGDRAGSGTLVLHLEATGDAERAELTRRIPVTVTGACDVTEDDIKQNAGLGFDILIVHPHEHVDCIDVTTDRTLKLIVLGTVEEDASVRLEDGAGLKTIVGPHGSIGEDLAVTYTDSHSWLFILQLLGTIEGEVLFEPVDGAEEVPTSVAPEAPPGVDTAPGETVVRGQPTVDYPIVLDGTDVDCDALPEDPRIECEDDPSE